MTPKCLTCPEDQNLFTLQFEINFSLSFCFSKKIVVKFIVTRSNVLSLLHSERNKKRYMAAHAIVVSVFSIKRVVKSVYS